MNQDNLDRMVSPVHGVRLAEVEDQRAELGILEPLGHLKVRLVQQVCVTLSHLTTFELLHKLPHYKNGISLLCVT